MKGLLKICFISIILLSTLNAFSEEYKSTIDYIQKTGKLWGISECIVNTNGSITLVDRKDQGYGYVLWIPEEKGSFLDAITLKLGESCDLIDGHHAFITYKFVKLENGVMFIEVTDKFNATSFGGKIPEEKKTVRIVPYKD